MTDRPCASWPARISVQTDAIPTWVGLSRWTLNRATDLKKRENFLHPPKARYLSFQLNSVISRPATMSLRTFVALATLGLATAQTSVVSLFIFNTDPQPLVGSIIAEVRVDRQ